MLPRPIDENLNRSTEHLLRPPMKSTSTGSSTTHFAAAGCIAIHSPALATKLLFADRPSWCHQQQRVT
jgi:hypothetical protein